MSGAGGAPGRSATFVFGALVIATVGGLFLAQRLKHTPTAVQSFRLSQSFAPGAASARGLEQLSFRTDHRDLVTVTILSSTGSVMATLVRGLRWDGYRTLCLAWNGRRGTGRLEIADGAPLTRPLGRCREAPVITQPGGALAPAGEYRARVELRNDGPPVLSPASFALLRGTAAGL